MKLCVTDEGQINYYKLLHFSSDSHTYTQFIFYISPNIRVRQGELPEGQEKVLWGTTSYHSGYMHKIGKEWKALHSPLFLMFNSALQWTPPALQVLAQLVSLFALGC